MGFIKYGDHNDGKILSIVVDGKTLTAEQKKKAEELAKQVKQSDPSNTKESGE